MARKMESLLKNSLDMNPKADVYSYYPFLSGENFSWYDVLVNAILMKRRSDELWQLFDMFQKTAEIFSLIEQPIGSLEPINA